MQRPLRVRIRPLPRTGRRHSGRQCFHRVCERMTQPIGLVVPDLLQHRLAKLREHAAHVDMIIGAVAQYDLRVAPVAQWLRGRPCVFCSR